MPYLASSTIQQQRGTGSRFGRMLVSSLFGALAASLLAPVAWLAVVVLSQPSTQGLSGRLHTLLGAAPAIALVAAVISFPLCAVLGPAVLAVAAKHPAAPRRLATAAGALIGAIAMAVPPLLSSTSSSGFSPSLSVFGAVLGTVGAWVAAKHYFSAVPVGQNAPAV